MALDNEHFYTQNVFPLFYIFYDELERTWTMSMFIL